MSKDPCEKLEAYHKALKKVFLAALVKGYPLNTKTNSRQVFKFGGY